MESLNEYSYLDKRIQRLIDSYVESRRDEITDEQIRKIHLCDINRYKFNDEEFDYAMNYLNNEGILVTGDSEVIYSNYDNYRYQPYRASKNREIPYKKLPNSEQLELLKQYRETNDKDTLTKLISSYIPLINLKALKYSSLYNMEYDDLKSTCYEALLNAFQKFDFRENTLISYVEKYVQGKVLRYVRDNYGLAHYSFFEEFARARNEIRYEHYGEDGYNEYDHIDEVSKHLIENGTCKDSFKDNRMVNLIYAKSLDEVEDSLEASDDVSLYKEVLEPIFQKKMKKYISSMIEGTLAEKKASMVLDYYGIDREKGSTLKEIADKTEVSFQYVHKVINSSCDSLLDNWIDYMAEFYDNDNDEYGFTPGKIEYDKPKYRLKKDNERGNK